MDFNLINPCNALPPNTELDDPLMTCISEERFPETSNRLFTLQKPKGRIGISSSIIKKDPQAPEPVKTGDLIEIKLS